MSWQWDGFAAEIKEQLENMLGDQFDAMHAEQKDQIDWSKPSKPLRRNCERPID
nr:hypothetical protein [Rhodopirellula sp. SM50]